MRKGSFTRRQRLVAIVATTGLIASLAVASATSGVKITAGEMEMTMAVSAEEGLNISVIKAGRRNVQDHRPDSSFYVGQPSPYVHRVQFSLAERD